MRGKVWQRCNFPQGLGLIFDNCRKYWAANDTDGIVLAATKFECIVAHLLDQALARCGYYANTPKYVRPLVQMDDRRRMEAVKKLQSIAVNFYHAMHKLDTYQIFEFHSLPKPISLSKNPKHYGKTYAIVCPSPMWFARIRSDISDRVINTRSEVIGAFLTMFNNCIEFSEPTSFYIVARRLKNKLKRYMMEFWRNCLLDPGTRQNALVHR